MSSCPAPPNVAFATFTYDNNTGTAVYTCSQNYTMAGYAQVNCTGESWNTTQIPSCSYSFNPDNANYVSSKEINAFIEIAPTWLLIALALVSAVAAISMITLLVICCSYLWKSWRVPFVRSGGRYVYPEKLGCLCNICRRKTEHRNLSKQSKKEKDNSHILLNMKVDEIVAARKKKAKRIEGWRPFKNNMRNINTSTN